MALVYALQAVSNPGSIGLVTEEAGKDSRAIAIGARETAASGLMLLSCLMLLAGAAVQCLALVKLAIPTLFEDTVFLSYGRLRPAAVSLLVYGFGGTFTQAAAYYLTPRLVGARLKHQSLALLAGVAYGALVLLGVLLILFRGPSGPESAEFPPLIDWPLAVLLLVPVALVTMMIRSRTEEGYYVSILYILGAVWWFPALYIMASIPGLGGMAPFLQTSLVTEGIRTLALPAAAIGCAYYVVVKESGRPLFSGPMARAGFWTLAGVALLATPARFLGGPAPNWTETVSVVASMGLILAALTVLANVTLTLAGDWVTARESPVIRTLLSGTIAYTVVTVLMGLSGFRSTAAVVGLTTWHEGLTMGLVLIAVAVLAMAFVFYGLPRTTGRNLSNPQLVIRGLRLTIWGGGITSGALMVSGLLKGLTWNWASASGTRTNLGEGFSSTMAEVDVLFTVAALSSLVALLGIVLLVWSAAATYLAGPARPDEILVSVDTADREEPV